VTILDDATKVLLALANYGQGEGDSQKGRYSLEGDEVADATGLSPERINDAVDILDESGYVRTMKVMGTAPYSFHSVELTPRGRVEGERVQSSEDMTTEAPSSEPLVKRSVTPVGSPYGFTDQDWAAVTVDRENADAVIVCFGYQWTSPLYSTSDLEANVEKMFDTALGSVNARNGTNAQLLFRKLEGGYGGHLFNEIARHIIGSDIAVFDTSDQNPNVMIELGVALTWGRSVLPMRDQRSPKTPSDISGQTWAEYLNSGATWSDPNHARKLEKLVELAISRKRST